MLSQALPEFAPITPFKEAGRALALKGTAIRNAFIVAALALIACVPAPSLVSAANASAYFTNAAPSSITAERGHVWFSYGVNINGVSGVGVLEAGRLTEIVRKDPNFQVNQVIRAGGATWFSASEGHSAGTIGTVSEAGLVDRVTLRGDYADAIAYLPARKAIVFVRGGANDYGWISDGRVSFCKAPGKQILRGSEEGPRFVAANGDAVWLFSDVTSSLLLLGKGCAVSATARVDLGDAHSPRNLGGLAVDQSGSVFLLDIKNGRLIVASRRRGARSLSPPLANGLTSISAIAGRICVTNHKPTIIECYLDGRWVTRRGSMPGIMSGLAFDGTSVWAAYASMDKETQRNVGAVIRMGSVNALIAR